MRRRGKQSPGVAFGDFITTEKVHHSSIYGSKNHSFRAYLLLPCIVLSVGLLFLKLFSLSIVHGTYYQQLADTNRTRTTIIHAPRGVIFDRNNVPLVYNTPGFREIVNGKTVFLTREDATLQIAQGKQNLEIDSLRQYPYKDEIAHVLGYIGEISGEELSRSEFAAYHGGDIIGKMGIEQSYEKQLKGIDGQELSEVNATGATIRKLGQTEPIAGADLHLTIDEKLQVAVYSTMKDVKKGAVIVSTPDGQILAMVSKPSFDPNLFTLGKSYKTASDSAYPTIVSILTGNDQSLLNRAISGVYPPGSTFKLVTAAAGLMSKSIDENYIVTDNGTLKVGSFSFGNWYYLQYGRTEGDVNVVKAIKRSNDIFFYKLAEKVGVDTISKTAGDFGLGKPLGIDIAGEAAGTLPTEEWKQKVIGEQWYLGDTYHYGIGQGYLLTTPLQVNAWTQVIANGGSLYEPHLLQSQIANRKSQNLLDAKSLQLIREGMKEACDTGGVAWPLFDFKVPAKGWSASGGKNPIDGENFTEAASASADFRHVVLGCKTGTAEHGSSETLPHAWITIIAPLYKPQLIITVLAESSGEGSNVAAPIAKKILESWFERQ